MNPVEEGKMGVFEFSELMVKWHVNDRPRGTHLGLKYHRRNLNKKFEKIANILCYALLIREIVDFTALFTASFSSRIVKFSGI